jgi:diaminohydroxyphosphoribosylaminopyrimidine deaminase/5-amino-6-(5-phosphoribosylamino)uracil reductase
MTDFQYMKRAIELAEKGAGYTSPNPLVGAVIVKDGRIIGEGYHELYGGPHAEINALLNASKDVRGSVMYVNLEPCSHYGKTGPCANAIVRSGIKKVVIGIWDPNPAVAGRGIEILRDSGIEVLSGVMEKECRKLNEIFLKFITTKNPFCILKTAMTLDGKIACSGGDSKWISNEESRNYVHQLRHRVSAVMVGIGTVLQDDPFLNTRLAERVGKDAIRIVVDTYAGIPLNANVLNIKSSASAIIATTQLSSEEKRKELMKKGAEVIVTPLCNNRVDLRFLMKCLGERNIDSILLEGGGEVNYSALESDIVDKFIFFISAKIVGGREAKTPVEGIGRRFMKDATALKNMEIHKFDDDLMIEAYIKR